MSGRIEISRRLLAVNTASAIATRLLGLSVLVWLQQYLLKRISAEEYSLLPVVYSLMMFTPFFTATLTSAIKRYVTEAYAGGNDARVTEIVSTMFPLLCLAAVLFVLAGGGIAWQMDVVFRFSPTYVDDARLMLVMLVCSVGIQLPLEAFGSGLFVKQRFVLQNLIELGSEVVRLCVLLGLLLGVSTSVLWVVVSVAVGDLVRMIAMTVVSRRLVPAQKVVWRRFRWPVARQLIAFGGWDSLDGFAGMVRKASGPLILNRLAGPLDVACFHLGSLVSNRLEILLNNSLGHTTVPVVIGLNAAGEQDRLKNAYLTLGRVGLWGLLLVVAPLVVHAEEIVKLYVGETYAPAATVMLLLLGCYPIVYGNFLHVALAKARLRMRGLAIRSSISAVLNVALTVILVGRLELGAAGAAAGTFVAYGLGSLVLLWPFGKAISGVSWRAILREIVLRGLAPFVAATAFMEWLSGTNPVTTWAYLGTNALAGSCVYVVVAWLVMHESDRKFLSRVVVQIARHPLGARSRETMVG